MKARVFFDAFSEVLVNVVIARRFPETLDSMRTLSVTVITVRHGDKHAEATGRMFDRLWADMQNPGAPK